MKKIVIVLSVISLVLIVLYGSLVQKDIEPTKLMELKQKYSAKPTKKVDHSAFASLNQKFTSPHQITQQCIICHNKTDKEVMNSNHWNWERPEYIKGRGIVYLGKKNAINNFCIGTQGNEESCGKCHIGYGLDQAGKSYTDSTNVDCLVCHDNTETYTKANEMGGAPVMTLDFNNIAKNVGRPKRSNCGVCHFYGGGGNNVKHGDLEMAMFETTKDVDVHMGTDGMNMDCVDCHTTHNHVIDGKLYSLSSMNRNRVTCEQCHTETPHEDDILNEHTVKVACQSCHIPEYAKVNSTKMYWDWSTAGKLKNGEPYEEDDSLGNHTYLSIKGSFKWARNVKPDYIWFNGTASHYLEGDVIEDTTKALILNPLYGSYSDQNSKITPVKIHVANQPFDPVNRMLIQPKLYSHYKGDGAFWKDFNWIEAAKKGMNDVGLPFSGKISFITTKMYWPINHMVSAKDKTVGCNECHVRENGRLAGLNDFYMPGRNYSSIVEIMGKLLIIFSIIGVLLHGTIRFISYRKLNKKGGVK